MATVKRKKKFDGTSAAAVVAGGVGGAGVAAGLGKLGVPPAVVGTALTTIGITGAALLDGRARMALGSCVGTGALVLLSSALSRAKQKKAEKVRAQAEERGERVAQVDKKGKKGRNADLSDDVYAMFEQQRANLAIDDEEREAFRSYRAA